MMVKKNLPVHGHLQIWAGRTKADVCKNVREKYVIPRGAKVHAEYMYSDGPFKIYDVEVVVPRRKK